MIKRRGFKKFIRNLEGVPLKEKTKKFSPPSVVWNKAPKEWRTETYWLDSSFRWSETPQGHAFWENIFVNGWTEEAKEIIEHWVEEGVL